MGLFFRKSKKVGKGARLNVSNKGVSASKKLGRISVSTRGNVSARIGKGINFRKKLF